MASRWAGLDRDIAALGLAGSWARSTEGMSSDVDLVVLTTSPNSYVQSEDWLHYFGGPPVVRTQKWGVLTERRVRLDTGLEIEFGFTVPGWAALPLLTAGRNMSLATGYDRSTTRRACCQR